MLTSISARVRPSSASSLSSSARRLGHVLGQRRLKPYQPWPKLGDARERGVALAAEVDRRVRLLHRLGVLAQRGHVVELAVVLGDVVLPQPAHHLDVLAVRSPRRSKATSHASNSSFEPADADAEVEAAVRQPVDGGDLLGRVDGVALRHEADAGAEPDASVTAARNDSAVNGSRMPLSPPAGILPSAAYGYCDAYSSNSTTCSAAQIEWNPRASASRPSVRMYSGVENGLPRGGEQADLLDPFSFRSSFQVRKRVWSCRWGRCRRRCRRGTAGTCAVWRGRRRRRPCSARRPWWPGRPATAATGRCGACSRLTGRSMSSPRCSSSCAAPRPTRWPGCCGPAAAWPAGPSVWTGVSSYGRSSYGSAVRCSHTRRRRGGSCGGRLASFGGCAEVDEADDGVVVVRGRAACFTRVVVGGRTRAPHRAVAERGRRQQHVLGGGAGGEELLDPRDLVAVTLIAHDDDRPAAPVRAWCAPSSAGLRSG